MPGTSDQAFLKPDVKIELLVGRWFAWPHLISPVQHAMNIAFRHLPLMQSFVANPQVHIAAANDPDMLGGPFLDLPETAVPEIKELHSGDDDSVLGTDRVSREISRHSIKRCRTAPMDLPRRILSIECRHPSLARLKFHTI